MIYFTHPEQKNYELIEKYRNMDWQKDEEALNKWQAGQTGYPIIDAAMRQLNQTGWMHNRLRMIVASFLTKDLLIDWRQGEAYFARQLIDYDAASNIGGWQWAASTGTDAVPYFRIFNPITQGKKFDKEGTFIKQFVPELAQLPLKFIHEPYLMTDEEQADLKVVLGTNYPLPIVDHNEARKRALDLYSKIEP
jgi:deoxyribodipyrimidine photo-lyase